jgi:hypothetical protein
LNSAKQVEGTITLFAIVVVCLILV